MDPAATPSRDYWPHESIYGGVNLARYGYSGRQADVCRLALEALPPMIEPENIVARFQSSESFGSLRGYATDSDGTPVSQSEFATLYVAGMNRIRSVAERLLLERGAVDELVEHRQSILESARFQRIAPALLPSRDAWRGVQSAYEESIRAQICRLSKVGDNDPELNLRATELAIMSLRLAEQQIDCVAVVERGGFERYNQIRALLQFASQQSRGDVTAYLEHFMTAVRDAQGCIPELRVWSDYDGNLSLYPEGLPESGGTWKPGEETNALINSLDKIAGYHLRHRLVMTEFPGLDSTRRQAADTLLRIACSVSKVFSDTPRFFEMIKQAGGSHRVLTANHWSMVQKQIALHGLEGVSDGIVGVRSDRHYTSKADLLLSDLLLREKMPVILFGEDNNSGIVNHLRTGASQVQKTRGLTLDLGEAIFFSAREPDAIANFAVAGVLKDRGIPHVIDQLDSGTGNGKAHSIAFVEAYIRTAKRLR